MYFDPDVGMWVYSDLILKPHEKCNIGRFNGWPECNTRRLEKFRQCREHYNLLQRVKRQFNGIEDSKITKQHLESCQVPCTMGRSRPRLRVMVDEEEIWVFHCSKCDKWKDSSSFHVDSRASSGLQSQCKTCRCLSKDHHLE